MKRWIDNPIEQCDEHGCDVEIFTDADQDGPCDVYCNDGDECRCSEGCHGWMTADGGSFYCNWDDEEDNAEVGGPTVKGGSPE